MSSRMSVYEEVPGFSAAHVTLAVIAELSLLA
jgi:hypothetical protein